MSRVSSVMGAIVGAIAVYGVFALAFAFLHLVYAFPWLLVGLLAAFVGLVVAMVASLIPRYRRGGSLRHARRVRSGKGLSVAELARRLEMDERSLRLFLPDYRSFRIAKRRGGDRLIQAPNEPTKALQRKLLKRILGPLRAHPAAHAFERRHSIVTNARVHAGRAVVIKLDLKDFFPATRAERVRQYFQWVGWDREAAEMLTRFVTLDGGLPQGAPTSPRLANLVNFYFDVQITAFVARRKGCYTRYADDLTVSFPKDYPKRIRGTIQRIQRIAKAHGYEVHTGKKFQIRRAHQRQTVTGLVVNEKVSLSRETRRWLRAVRHRVATGRRVSLDPAQIQGWKAYEAMVYRAPRRER